MASGVRSKLNVVLFVEDNPDVRELYGSAMRAAGLLVDEVVTVAEAIELAARVRFDIIVLDRELPDGDGWDVARSLKASPSTRDVPIIAFTSHHERSDVEGALVAGCDAFVEKGCSPDSLARHVRGMLDLPLDANDANDANDERAAAVEPRRTVVRS